MEGSPGPDARFFRALACGLEDAGEFLAAEPAWERFLAEAVREGRFGPQSIEAAAVHLHIAEMLGRAAQPMHGQGGKGESHSPHSRFARACALDPHSEAFAAWKRWAQGRSASKVEEVCREWHRACPGDLEPLLYLMERAEGRSAFPKALALLEKAERADSMHPKVRAARLRLQGASALRSLQQRKTHLAEERLAALAALPQASQGVRPAFVNALRHLLALTGGDRAAAAAARAEVERLLEHKLAASLLIFGIADLTNHDDLIHLPELKSLSPAERAEIPKGLARAMTVASDFALQKFKSPIAYINEAQEQFLRSPRSLDTRETEMMGELGLASSRYLLAWAAAGAGLAAGGPAEAGFLLQRARALHGEYETRAVALAAAAVQLARLRGDTEVADRAIAIAAASERQRPVVLTLEQAREVIRRELASPAYPTPGARGPDYSDLVPSEGLCQCPACRARRGEDFNPFEDDEEDDDEVEVDFTGGPRLGFGLDEKAMRDIFDSKAPAGLPPGAG